MKAILSNSEVKVYSTYDMRERLKSVPGSKWNPSSKTWDFPPGAVPELVQSFPDITLDTDVNKIYHRELWKQREKNKILSGARELPEHPFLYKHQRIVRALSTVFDRFGFFADTGTGKTNMGLQIITDNLPRKALVLTPKPIIKTGWMEDQAQFFPDLRLLPLSRNMLKSHYAELAERWGMDLPPRLSKDGIFGMLVHQAQAYVTNYEAFKADYEFICTLGCRMLLLDESAKLRNGPRKNKTVKAVINFADEMDKVYLMSGKPAPRSEEDYFYQAYLINPLMLGRTVTAFRNKYFYPDGYGGYTWKPFKETPKEIGNRLMHQCLFIRKEDCLDLPDKTYEVRSVELSAPVMKHYRQMEKVYMTMIDESNELVTTPGKVQAIMKLRQITGGFLIDEDSKVHHLHDEKLYALEETLEELGDHRAIIWVQFKHEVRAIMEMIQRTQPDVPVSTAYSGTKDIDQSISDFKHGRTKYMIAHPKSLMYGATFVQDCSYALYYSLSYDYEEYYQSHDRIYRNGQTKKCTFLFFVAEGTIDEVIRETVLSTKQARSVAIEDIIDYRKRVSK